MGDRLRGVLARRAIRQGLRIAIAAAVFGVWQFLIGRPSLGTGLASLGLDQERVGLAVALAGVGLTGGVGGLLGLPWPAWLLSDACFLAGYLLPALVGGLPAPAPGEQLSPSGLLAAIGGQTGLAVATGGLAAGAGELVRGSALSGWRRLRSRKRDQVRLAAATAGLLILSGFGLWEAPGIFLYGPWQGVFASSLPKSARELTLKYHSSILGGEQQAIVILPPGYESESKTRYPVLYLLHGSPGSDRDWPSQGAGDLVAAAAQAGYAPPMVVVAPNGDGPRGGSHDSWADNYVPGDLIESSLLDELMPAVAARFRVLSDQSHQAIGGLSSGGYGAVNLALRHPGRFAAAFDFSGDVQPPAVAFGGNQDERRANDPLLLSSAPRPPQASAFFIGWGDGDPYRAQNQQLAAQLRASGYLVRTAIASGGHQWAAWRSLLWDSLTQLGHLIGQPQGA